MKCELIKLGQFNGKGCNVYTVRTDDLGETLFDGFINECIVSFISETKDILMLLNAIGHKEGAREHYFKHAQGKPGDGLCALYDRPGSHLRLYCIRFGMDIIILGGGGQKLKSIKALQEDLKLTTVNDLLKRIAKK